MTAPTFQGTVPPERSRDVAGFGGIRLRVHEWGDPKADPVVLCHGMWDHSRAFDTFAPLLADRLRVVAVDARGHGESEWADSYTWYADIADIVCVLRDLGQPTYLLGHSKGGGQASDAAVYAKDSVRKLVNIDGFGPPDGFDRFGGQSKAAMLAASFDRQLKPNRAWRPASDIDDLVERRRSQNPRLTTEWLRYLVFHAARKTEGGWVWKADPTLMGGFGPFEPSWIATTWTKLDAPTLGIIGSEQDTWGPLPEETLQARVATIKRFRRIVVSEAGHFVHMEQPAATAALVLDFLRDG